MTLTQRVQARTRGGATEIAVSAIAAAMMAVALGGARHKLLLAAVGGLVLVAVMVLARHRERVLFGFLVLSLGFVLHKSFGPIALNDNGGPPSLYLSTIDVCVLGLYGIWFWSGDLVSDLRAGMRHVAMFTPIVGMVLMLPSLLVTHSVRLGFAEFERMTLLYLLFVYVAVRTTRKDVKLALILLGGLAVFEFLVVAGQWVTHSPLGFSFLGLPTELGTRVTNGGDIERPFGTITHPVFLGAFIGPLAALFFAAGIALPGRRTKTVALIAMTAAGISIAIAEARSAALGLAVGMFVIVALSVTARRLHWRIIRRWAAALLALAVVCSPVLISLYHADLFTSHFSLELQARGQLVTVGFRIFHAHPIAGTGLNTFQQVMDQYNPTGLIFDGNPVHNIYVLQAAETGLIGLLAIPVIAIPLGVLAFRTARSKDALSAALGIGFVGVLVFFAVEEMFVFSLREDHPRSMFWLLAGLLVAAARFSGLVPGRDGGDPEHDDPLDGLRRRLRGLLPAKSGTAPKPARIPLPSPRRAAPRPGFAHLLAHFLIRLVVRPMARVAHAVAARNPKHRRPSPTGRHRGRRRVAIPVSVAMSLSLAVVWMPAGAAGSTDNGIEALLTLTSRADNTHEIYTANGDGSDLRRITDPSDGLTYQQAEWTPGASRITYAAGKDVESSPEQLYLSKPDGSDPLALTGQPWRSGQSHMSPDGRSVIFTSASPGYPEFGVYSLDVASLQVSNLSARFSQSGSADTDPTWSPDSSHVVFVQGANYDQTGKPIVAPS